MIHCKIYKSCCMGFLCSADNHQDKTQCYHAEIRGGSKENKLKVMADFSSSGIWDGNTGVMIHFDYIFDCEELANEFEKWIKYYDESFKEDFSTLKEGTAEKYNKWGRELAQKLKDKMVDLGTGEWEITYQGADDKYYLLEIGSFSCAGLYACDMKPIVETASTLALKCWDEIYNI